MEGVLPYKDENMGEIALNRWVRAFQRTEGNGQEQEKERFGRMEWNGRGQLPGEPFV